MSDNLLKSRIKADPFAFLLCIIYILSFICVGVFHEATASVFGAVLSIILLIYAFQNKKIVFRINITTIAVSVIVLSYALSVFWATDKGTAPIGFVKFLPAFLFMLLFMQQNGDTSAYKKMIPHLACAMTVISAVLMQIEPLSPYFSVAGRLSGFFEYPNTYAIFVLIGLIITLTSENIRWYGYLESIVMLFGILYSGSRMVFILTVFAVIASLIVGKNKKTVLIIVPVIVLCIAGIAVYSLVSGNTGALSRFMTSSLKSSTLVGRVIYITDALPQILKHPFGHGYLTYYLTQQNFQSAVYSVRYIHNDYLQFAFDIGIIPALLFAAMIIVNIFKKTTAKTDRLVLAVLAVHMFFDFDIQFISMFFLLIVFCNVNCGKTFEINKLFLPRASAAVLALFALYMAVPLSLSLAEKYEKSRDLYPFNTDNNILLMSEREGDEQSIIADRIMSQNKYVSAAYSVKAVNSFSKGNFKDLINYSKKAVSLAPYTYDNYETSCYMLMYGVDMYEKSGDEYSKERCNNAVLDIYSAFTEANENINPLGRLIRDEFKESLPEDICEYVAFLKGGE